MDLVGRSRDSLSRKFGRSRSGSDHLTKGHREQLAVFLEETKDYQIPSDEQERKWQVEWLDEVLTLFEDHSSPLFKQGLHRLNKICRRSQLLPESCILAGSRLRVDMRPNVIRYGGGYSDVFVGTYKGKGRSSVVVAVKILRVRVYDSSEAYFDEVSMWKSLKHDNIVPFLGISKEHPNSLVSLWMQNGPISRFLQGKDDDRTKYIRDIVKGLKYLHDLDIIHGDLKPMNILVDGNSTARLADFGVSIIYMETHSQPPSAITLRYFAPEFHQADMNQSNLTWRNCSSDYFALGITVWELFSGTIPFPDFSENLVYHGYLEGQRPRRPVVHPRLGMTDGLWKAIQNLWDHVPMNRDLSLLCDAVFAAPSMSPLQKPLSESWEYVPRGRTLSDASASSDWCLLSRSTELMMPAQGQGASFRSGTAYPPGQNGS